MNNQLTMSAEFERQKNIQASAITAAIAGALLFILIWVKMTIPHEEVAPAEEYIEVNLGSGDQGFGTDQPQLPGDPAPAQQTSYTPPQPVKSSEESVRDVASDNETSNDAPPVVKPAVSKPDATKINAESKTARSTNTHPQPVVQAPPRPKAILGRTVGGNGNGGNGADTYRPGGNEGIAGGTGDQGRVGGSPNGKNYTGVPRNFGVKVLNIPNQSFEDDFNQNAKIAVEITVNEAGKVTNTALTPRGSSGTATQSMKNTALRLARQLKFGTTEGGQKGVVIFDFKVRG